MLTRFDHPGIDFILLESIHSYHNLTYDIRDIEQQSILKFLTINLFFVYIFFYLLDTKCYIFNSITIFLEILKYNSHTFRA